jgi:uncharacterized RmlC-like cupin family protein
VSGGIDPFHRKLFRVASGKLIGDTMRTSGMTRREAISGKTIGSKNLWMGQTHVVDGDEPAERRVDTAPGDYIVAPPYVPDREDNPNPIKLTEVAVALRLTPRGWSVKDVPERPAADVDRAPVDGHAAR